MLSLYCSIEMSSVFAAFAWAGGIETGTIRQKFREQTMAAMRLFRRP
jgi:hypothetical protein